MKKHKDFVCAGAADSFYTELELAGWENIAVLGNVPEPGMCRVTYSNGTSAESYLGLLKRYLAGVKESEIEREQKKYKSYEWTAKHVVVERLSDSYDDEVAKTFFKVGFLGQNPKYTSVGSINEANEDAKTAYKQGKVARNNPVNQRQIRIETLNIRRLSIEAEKESGDLEYVQAHRALASGLAVMGPEGFDS